MKWADKLGVASILLPLCLGACMQIVGIEDPKRLEDKPSEESSAASSGSGSSGSSSGSGSGSSGGMSGPWVSWPMPNPTSVGLPNPASYSVDMTKDIITDSVTGLMWQRTVDVQSYTWENAKTFCENLSQGGYDDWRLPWRIELVSLIDFTKQFPAIDGAFPNTPAYGFWSATPYVADTNQAWLVYFDNGDTFPDQNTTAYRARCVRSN